MTPDLILKPNGNSSLRVALVHYWYLRRGGGEQVLDVLADMFPQADIFTIVNDPAAFSNSIKSHNVSASFLQKLPKVKHYYRALLPFFPLALEQLRLDDYDLVISQESGPAKGVITRAVTCHICYCHTPMRYLWDMYHDYLATAPLGALGKAFYSLACHYVRQWDYASAARVDHFVASSQNCTRRIRKYYGRSSEVIYPPVNVDSFSASDSQDDYYLVVSRLVPYKRIDLAVKACSALGRRLAVIGEGPRMAALQQMAGPTITFLGAQPDEVVREHYRRCRAFLFPGEEDIGLTPIEAQASGRPVIAYGRGGALETVVGFCPGQSVSCENYTGVFFQEQSVESLKEAILAFEEVEGRFSPALIRSNAERFDTAHFQTAMAAFVSGKLAEFRESSPGPELQSVAV
jgi:glycosyltransferase involved in cell wall biosynthesis